MLILSMALLAFAQSEPPDRGARTEVAQTQLPAQQNPERLRTLQLHDVRDIVDRMAVDFEPPVVGEQVDPAPVAPTQPGPTPPRPVLDRMFEQAREEQPVALAARALEGVLRTYVEPKLDDPADGINCTATGTLVANLRAEQHASLESILAVQRSFDGFVQVETVLYQLPRGLLAKWKVEQRTVLPTLADRDAFRARLDAERDVSVINAPSLMTLANQRANVSVLNQIAYVADWTIEIVEPGAQEIADPRIEVANEGVMLDLRATPLPDQRFGLDLQLTHCTIARPIRTTKVRLNTKRSTEVEIGLPEVSTVRIKSIVVIADGASVVLSSPGPGDDEDFVMIVTARRVGREQLERTPVDER